MQINILTCGPVTPQHLPSFCSLSHSSVNSIEFPYSCAKRYLYRLNRNDKYKSTIIIQLWHLHMKGYKMIKHIVL